MNPAEKLLEKLKFINKVEECLEPSSENQLYIKDISGTAILTNACIEQIYCFSIINKMSNDIYFIPIDGEGIIGNTTKCCDAVIFDDIYFTFIELKLNAKGKSRRRIYQIRTKAVEQITNTINFFNDKLNKNYEGLSLEAIIATPETFPRADVRWAKIAVKFADENNGIPLIETTKKIYQN